jgi:hypothetical protein
VLNTNLIVVVYHFIKKKRKIKEWLWEQNIFMAGGVPCNPTPPSWRFPKGQKG